MYNIEPIIYKGLSKIAKTYPAYPSNWNTLPVISYTCMNDSVAVISNTNKEQTTYFSYKIDLFVNKMDFSLVEKINTAMTDIGFTRASKNTIQEPNGLIHTVFMYSMYLNSDGYAYASL